MKNRTHLDILVGRAVKRILLGLSILGVMATSSGCLWVHDDDGHRHWRWHHEEHHDFDHDDHMDHHDDH